MIVIMLSGVDLIISAIIPSGPAALLFLSSLMYFLTSSIVISASNNLLLLSCFKSSFHALCFCGNRPYHMFSQNIFF